MLLLAVSGPARAEAAPDFAADVWLNSPPLTLASERGKVVMVYFWTFGCHNCKAVQPYVKDWYDTYREQGFEVVSVHAPEFSFERNIDNVKRFVAEHDVRYPVAIDNDFKIWKRYENRYWPVIYLIDRTGQMRYRKIGEGGYHQTRRAIEQLLAEAEVREPAAAAKEITR
ncbi:MAG: redoxin domain-containing protein [Leptospirillia bacterium]